MATAATWLSTAADYQGGAVFAGGGELYSLAGWIVPVLVAVPVVGKVLVVWLALRHTAPGDRLPIIAVLAELLRPRGGARDNRGR